MAMAPAWIIHTRSTMAVSSSTTLLLPAILPLLLLLLLPSPSTAKENNIFITGDVLPSNDQLTDDNGAVLVMQDDCNLVLYNNGKVIFQTGTSGLSSNCTLILSEFGQLLVKKSNGEVLWASPYTRPKGEYAVILQPDGHLGFYGPTLWNDSGPEPHVVAKVEKVAAAAERPAQNLMFSSDVLMTGKGKLVNRDYALEVVDGCNLRLTRASVATIWETENRGTRVNCFARLTFHGQLLLFDDDYFLLSLTPSVGPAVGIYALVLKNNGNITIYGYRYWSTALAA